MAVRKFLYSSGGDLKQSSTSDDLSVNTLTSNVATGTAPFTVASTTVVTNLNADKLDGNDATAFATSSHSHTSANITDFTEAAQDATGAMIVDTNSVNLTYTDATPSLTADVRVDSTLTITSSGVGVNSITAAKVSDFDTEVSNNTDVAANTGARHSQNTDTGTTSTTFHIDSDATGPKLKNNSGVLEIRNSGDTDYADLVVENLTVNGTSTTIHSETLTVADNVIVLNNNVTGTPSENGGIEVERGTSTNASLVWDESNDYWIAGVAGSEDRILLSGDNISLLTNNSGFITSTGVTYENLNANGDVGTGATQVAQGNHTHDDRYYTETEIGTNTGTTGSDLVGDDDSYSNFTPAAATVKGALSGIDSALGSITGANLVATYTAGVGGISQYNVVYVSAANTVLKADASAIATARAIGIANAAISASASGVIVTQGLIPGCGSGWTAGAPVFLSETAGALTHTAPTASNSVILQVGIAKNATDLQIQFGTPIINS